MFGYFLWKSLFSCETPATTSQIKDNINQQSLILLHLIINYFSISLETHFGILIFCLLSLWNRIINCYLIFFYYFLVNGLLDSREYLSGSTPKRRVLKVDSFLWDASKMVVKSAVVWQIIHESSGILLTNRWNIHERLHFKWHSLSHYLYSSIICCLIADRRFKNIFTWAI